MELIVSSIQKCQRIRIATAKAEVFRKFELFEDSESIEFRFCGFWLQNFQMIEFKVF